MCSTHFKKQNITYNTGPSFPGSSNGKETACNAGDLGSTSGLGSSPGEGKGITLQYSCLENSMDRGAWSQIAGHKWVTFTSLFTFSVLISLEGNHTDITLIRKQNILHKLNGILGSLWYLTSLWTLYCCILLWITYFQSLIVFHFANAPQFTYRLHLVNIQSIGHSPSCQCVLYE